MRTEVCSGSGGTWCGRIEGQTPFVAFFVDAFIVAFATAVGDVVKEDVDPDNTNRGSTFFIYIVIVFLIAFGIKLLLYVGYGFGGGSLAPPGRVETVGCSQFFYGNTPRIVEPILT